MKRHRTKKPSQTETRPSRCGLKEILLYPHPEMNVAGAGMVMKFSMPAFFDNPKLAARYERYFFDGIHPPTERERGAIEETLKEPDMKGFKGVLYSSRCD